MDMNAMIQQMAHMNMMMGMPPPMMGLPPPCKHRTLTAIEFDDSFAFTCNGCREMGYGSCYQCTNGCDYHLHEECLTASQVAYHHFYEQLRFTIQRQLFPNSNNLCAACGMAVEGWRYSYKLQSGSCIFLHPCCMKMPNCIETDEGDSLYLKQKLVSLKCDVCDCTKLGGSIHGWAYVSADQDLVCHVKCMKDMMYEDWSIYAHMEGLEGPWWLNPYGYGGVYSDGVYSDGCDLIPGPQQQVVYHHYHSYVGNQPTTVTYVTTSPAHPRQQQQQQQQQYHNNSLVPWVRPSSSSGSIPSRPVAPAQGHHNNSLALTTPTKPTGRKRRVFWKLTKAAVQLLFSASTLDPSTAISAVYDLL